ncbi:hypothetical protein [Microcystis aeruginosa]|uniref:Uncharacterized protein n=2 Tax=Microcystis aeruginosa TaxID=1126 RepID=L7E4W1_MICAE|nr:hypothetical protein [Microcystis aeruginosa]ARI83108.1 hypothetical protein BH695_3829 [Microcystis aeruginosa PCC 7806SL]ELP53916.1 hypothetical protein O53_2727 [Microcystis aeruginosa TAIHU98]ELS49938.1 hypothetical protein C789_289 [Microcystis aeruginosa FACHB-905 = DIANCHI905]
MNTNLDSRLDHNTKRLELMLTFILWGKRLFWLSVATPSTASFFLPTK